MIALTVVSASLPNVIAMFSSLYIVLTALELTALELAYLLWPTATFKIN